MSVKIQDIMLSTITFLSAQNQDFQGPKTQIQKLKSSQVAFNTIVASALSYKGNKNTVQNNVRVSNTYTQIIKKILGL